MATIIVGVTGGVAAFKAPVVARALTLADHDRCFEGCDAAGHTDDNRCHVRPRD